MAALVFERQPFVVDPQQEQDGRLEVVHVDGVFGDWARLYLTQEEFEKLQRLGYGVSLLPLQPVPRPEAPQRPGESGLRTIPTTYHTYDTLTAELNSIATAHPGLTRLFTLGTSASLPPDPPRELWMLPRPTSTFRKGRENSPPFSFGFA